MYKILYFQHQIKSPVLNVKNKVGITLIAALVCVNAPHM